MNIIMSLLYLLFSAAVVLSDQSRMPLISFKISENVTYDCMNILKQPGLDHPLLKNHTIQMKPSVSRFEINNETRYNKTYKNKIKCPYGTVPVFRNTKEFIATAQLFAEKYYYPLSADSPGTHTAGVRSSSGPFHGVTAWIATSDLNIKKDQASYSQIYIGSGSHNQVNLISAGLMVNPGLFGDSRLWSYGFWKGKDGKGCYNTACEGFIQVSHEVPIVAPIDLEPGELVGLRCSIHQDAHTGNWWITQINSNENVGYWPKELFNLLDNGANMVGVGGVVQASQSGSSPPMGNGHFPGGPFRPLKSAIMTNIGVLSSNYEERKMNSFQIEKLLDSQCYGLKISKEIPIYTTKFGFFINYGGPGGNSCGV